MVVVYKKTVKRLLGQKINSNSKSIETKVFFVLLLHYLPSKKEADNSI
jgi:hypothetical protein